MMKDRAGKISKTIIRWYVLLFFTPSKLPPNPKINIDNKMANLLIEAHKVLAILDEKSKKHF